jgi:hypothetical protein
MARLMHRPSGEETSTALAAVLQDQAERKLRREAPAEPRDWSRIASLAAVPLAFIALWLIVAPPAMLRPPPVPAPTPQDVRNALHLDIYVAAAQVMGYSAQNGRLPGSLAEALAEPGSGEGLTYSVRPGGVFEIAGQREGQVVVYVSTQSLRDFVASARAAVEAGAGS